MLKLWLPPNVWFHGSQSTITGGRSVRNVQAAAMLSWFEHSMRWVLITPLGSPVDPDVKRILATVSGPTAAKAASTAGVGRNSVSAANGVTPAPPALATTSTLLAPIASRALE